MTAFSDFAPFLLLGIFVAALALAAWIIDLAAYRRHQRKMKQRADWLQHGEQITSL